MTDRRELLQQAAAAPISPQEILKKGYCQTGRTKNTPAPASAEEYVARKEAANQAMQEMMAKSRGKDGPGPGSFKMPGGTDSLGITPEQFMQNVPAWLGTAPEITDIAYEESCDVLVLGAGQAGTTATLRLAELGLDVLNLEVQTWEAYDNYACDMATYNSRFFLNLGVPEYDLMEVYNEYMRKSLSHAHPRLVRDYVTRSGEMLDWMLRFIPQELIDRYAHATNYKGNDLYSGETCGQKSFIAMLQWRDRDTNNNMWPYVIRSLHRAAEQLGARHKYGAQAIRLLQDDSGAVVGAIANDYDRRFFKISAKAVVVACGDFGGNPDMALDLSDTMRNLAWSVGLDRTSTASIGGNGRDGSGIRMMLWAGARMEPGPRAGQGGSINAKPGFAFGGCWPTFGPDGRRFMNETLCKFGANGQIDMLRPQGILTCVTDANWDEYCRHQGYGHEVMDRSNDYMLRTVRRDMENYKTGPDGFGVHNFSVYGNAVDTVYAADTLEELADILGYAGRDKEGFLQEIARWNDFCEKGHDDDWGCDPEYLFPIRTAPFFGVVSQLRDTIPTGGLCQHGGVITDGAYRVLTAHKDPIRGLYAAGNCCGQRYGVQYHTPTAGNSCGSALTTGYCAAEQIVQDLRNG